MAKTREFGRKKAYMGVIELASRTTGRAVVLVILNRC